MRARRPGLFGHVAKLDHEVLASSIPAIGCDSSDDRHLCAAWRRLPSNPRTTWLHQVRDDTRLSRRLRAPVLQTGPT